MQKKPNVNCEFYLLGSNLEELFFQIRIVVSDYLCKYQESKSEIQKLIILKYGGTQYRL